MQPVPRQGPGLSSWFRHLYRLTVPVSDIIRTAIGQRSVNAARGRSNAPAEFDDQ